MLVNDDSISPEEKIKQLVEFEEGKRRELEEKRKEIEKKRKELEDLEKRGAQEIEEVRKEIEKRIEELRLEEKKRFEELEELRRRREEERTLEETIEEEERGANIEAPEQRAYGDVIEEILRGTPTFYDITNYNVMNRLEHIARAAGERPVSDEERKFIELVQYHAERMRSNKFYMEKDTSDYIRRELEKIDLINREIRRREEKRGDYQP